MPGSVRGGSTGVTTLPTTEPGREMRQGDIGVRLWRYQKRSTGRSSDRSSVRRSSLERPWSPTEARGSRSKPTALSPGGGTS